MRRALIVGADGQDGRILRERRASECARSGESSAELAAATYCVTRSRGASSAVDLQSAGDVAALVSRFEPEEIYYLAAHHHSAEERPDEVGELRGCLEVHVVALLNVLEAMRRCAPRCRLFYAGSSQMFGQPVSIRQDELTPFAPRNAYAVTKVAGAHLCALYREKHGLHASVGILYNHESPVRGPRFVSQRIVRGARAAARDPSHRLKLGSLSAVVDWGYAPDFVDAMDRILKQATPDDYVIATGEPHTVEDFARIAFAELGLDHRNHVDEDPSLVAPSKATLVGDSTRLRERTGWSPTVSFEQMVSLLVAGATKADCT